jgi:hypothetical protein
VAASCDVQADQLPDGKSALAVTTPSRLKFSGGAALVSGDVPQLPVQSGNRPREHGLVAFADLVAPRAISEPVLRERLEAEAKELTWIGNNTMIRHTEVGKPPIAESAEVDYPFHRMFAIIRLLLKSSGQGG